MRKLYEIFKLLWIQKRIIAAATIWGNTVFYYLQWRQNFDFLPKKPPILYAFHENSTTEVRSAKIAKCIRNFPSPSRQIIEKKCPANRLMARLNMLYASLKLIFVWLPNWQIPVACYWNRQLFNSTNFPDY